MERQFLILSLFFLLGLSSCQSNPTKINNIDFQCGSSSLSDKCVNDIILPIEEPKPVAKNVWDYMIINNNYDQNIILDEKTLSYISNHIKDKDKLNDFLNKSYYLKATGSPSMRAQRFCKNDCLSLVDSNAEDAGNNSCLKVRQESLHG